MTTQVPRDAATVVVVRDAPGQRRGIEILLLRRADGPDQNSGAWVFPGGLVDRGDHDFAGLTMAMDDAQASAVLGLPDSGLAFYLAAIRECFEEAGLLLAVNGEGHYASPERESGWPAAAWRDDVHQGRMTLADLCRTYALRLVPERLHYIAHWLTPLGRAKRFDTRFFVAAAPQCQSVCPDATETLDHVWITPDAAMERRHALRLMVPTWSVIDAMQPFEDVASLLAWAAAQRDIPMNQPRLGLNRDGLQSIPPSHPAYEELAKLDPEGRCDAWCELRPEVPTRLSPHVVRITDGNGRNRYLVGSDAQGWEPVPAAAVRLVEPDKIVIAPGITQALSVHKKAEWFAGAHGFLQRLPKA